MLDRDVAKIYGTDTRSINQAVNRNPDRFPDDFRFQLTEIELKKLRSQLVISSDTNKLPYGYTREGCNMLSACLHTPIAIDRSILIMRAFSKLEQMVQQNRENMILTPEYRQIISDLEFLRHNPHTGKVWNPLHTTIYVDDLVRPHLIRAKRFISKAVIWFRREKNFYKRPYERYFVHYNDRIFKNGHEIHETAEEFMMKYDVNFDDRYVGHGILKKYAGEIEQARIRKMEIRGCEIKKFLT